MSDFHFAAKVAELVNEGKLLVEVEDQLVILFRVNDEYFCLDDVCTHDGGPLSDGSLDGYEISCPRHGAKFDVRCGKALTMPATRSTCSHDIKIEGEDILVKLNS